VLVFLGAVAVGKELLAQSELVVVRPVETRELLVNPGMGITTFQRYNGDALNPPLKWSEEGPTTIIAAPTTRPDFPEASIAYCRWYWSALEPQPSQYQWDIVDLALDQARSHGQSLAIRMMPYDSEHPLPEWYRLSGAKRANKASDEDGKVWQPDFGDPLYLKYWGELVAAAGARYDGHPDLDSVDISSIGYWGEGWSPFMPDFHRQTALIDVYLEAFKKTALLMNFDEPRALSYATTRGTGWRLDCLGDLRTASSDPYFPPEMLDVYPQQIARTGIQDVWKRSPVSLEVCWVPGYWMEQGWDVSYILNQALRWHVSSLNIKSSAIPAEWKGLFEEFQKQMGYRFVLRRLEYPKSVKAAHMMPVKMWWFNAGVAPVYRDYILGLEFRSGTDQAVVRTSAEVRKWLPGDSIYEDTLYVPETLKPGNYSLRLALLDPRTGQPAIRLAIPDRDPDGWYRLGTLILE
jgi:hypothetical protein